MLRYCEKRKDEKLLNLLQDVDNYSRKKQTFELLAEAEGIACLLNQFLDISQYNRPTLGLASLVNSFLEHQLDNNSFLSIIDIEEYLKKTVMIDIHSTSDIAQIKRENVIPRRIKFIKEFTPEGLILVQETRGNVKNYFRDSLLNDTVLRCSIFDLFVSKFLKHHNAELYQKAIAAVIERGVELHGKNNQHIIESEVKEYTSSDLQTNINFDDIADLIKVMSISDPLDFIKHNESRFPCLKIMIREDMAIPTGNTDLESLFHVEKLIRNENKIGFSTRNLSTITKLRYSKDVIDYLRKQNNCLDSCSSLLSVKNLIPQ